MRKHPVLSRLTSRIENPSDWLPRGLPFPKAPQPEQVISFNRAGERREYEAHRAPADFYDWLDNFVVHRLDDKVVWQRVVKRAVSPLTCYLFDVSLGVYDKNLWEEDDD